LEAILADPDDDQARAVHADELVERGDPRGELIQLQLRASDDVQAIARADRLLAAHGDRWFPPRVHVRRGFVEKIGATVKGFEEIAAHEPIVGLLGSLPPPSPRAARLRELELGDAISAGELRALPQTVPALKTLSCRVERLDDDVVEAIESLRLDGLTIGLTDFDERALARVLVAPRSSIGVGVPVGRIAALGVVLRAARVLLAGYARAEDLQQVLGPAAPTGLTMIGTDVTIEWFAGWPGRAGIERLQLRSVDARLLHRLARIDGGFAPRELTLIGQGAYRLPRGDLAPSPAFARLESLHLSTLDLGRAGTDLLIGLPRLTTFTSDRSVGSIRKLAAAAPPRLVRLETAGEATDRWPPFRRFAWI
jgi:uncharacterized protein (TIGR02996 family)